MSKAIERTENGVELWRSDLLHGGQVIESVFIVKDPTRTPETWPFGSRAEAIEKFAALVEAARI